MTMMLLEIVRLRGYSNGMTQKIQHLIEDIFTLYLPELELRSLYSESLVQ